MDWPDLTGDAWDVAPKLLGSYLIRALDGQQLVGKIVEVEAYDQSDAASHSYKGKSARTEAMFGPAGHLYVYFTYGMYYCCNVVTGSAGHGSAVLIRALEPIEGMRLMGTLRHTDNAMNLTTGPGKLCQAFAIDKQLNGHDLRVPPLCLKLQPAVSPTEIVQTTRIGITKAQDVPWRFYLKGPKYVSRIT